MFRNPGPNESTNLEWQRYLSVGFTPNYHGQKGGPQKSPYGGLDWALGWNLETNCLRNPKNMACEIFYLLVVEQGLHTSGVKRFTVSPSVSSKWKKTLSEVVTLFSTKASTYNLPGKLE